MDINTMLIYVGCLIVIFIIGKIFILPLKKIFKLLMNSILGGGLIFIINLIGQNFNFHIGLNIGTALFTGIFGIPGAILLMIISQI